MTVKTAPAPTKGANRVFPEAMCLTNRWLWTVEELQSAYDLGVFGYDTRLELVEGEIIWK